MNNSNPNLRISKKRKEMATGLKKAKRKRYSDRDDLIVRMILV
jgi:hypothetical protein